MVFNGKLTRDWLLIEDNSSPMSSLVTYFWIKTMDVYEGRDITVMDFPNVFIQTNMTQNKDVEERVTIKIIGIILEILVELYSETYKRHVVFENRKKSIYDVLLREIYGMLVAPLLLYKKCRGDLEIIGFEFNPYDQCVANRIKVGKQRTVIIHVDDVIYSHVNNKVNDNLK